MGIPTGTGMRSLRTPSPNHSGKDVFVVLILVGATASVLSNPPVSMKAFPGDTSSKPKSPLQQHLLCGGYPPPKPFVLTFLGYGPRSSCDMEGGVDMLLRQSALKTQPTPIVAWVRM